MVVPCPSFRRIIIASVTIKSSPTGSSGRIRDRPGPPGRSRSSTALSPSDCVPAWMGSNRRHCKPSAQPTHRRQRTGFHHGSRLAEMRQNLVAPLGPPRRMPRWCSGLVTTRWRAAGSFKAIHAAGKISTRPSCSQTQTSLRAYCHRDEYRLLCQARGIAPQAPSLALTIWVRWLASDRPQHRTLGRAPRYRRYT